MNVEPIFKPKMPSCGIKKPAKKRSKSATTNKINLQSTISKNNNSNSATVNNSLLTQRIKTNSKSKVIPTNSQNEPTVRIKSSNKKIPKAISKMKTDRKAEYTKLKAQQIQSEIAKKINSAAKKSKKSVDMVNQVSEKQQKQQNTFNKISIMNQTTKIGSFLSEGTHRIAQANKNSDSFMISEIQKNQKQLVEKIVLLEQQRNFLSQRSNAEINSIKNIHQEQLNSLRQQMRNLSLKLNQQSNTNSLLSKKVENTQNQYFSVKQKLSQKDQRLVFLDQQNKQLQEDLKSTKNSIKEYQNHIKSYQAHIKTLDTNVSQLRSQNIELRQKLQKQLMEKKYIRQNCVQVLGLLREEFGQEFKYFSC